MKNNHQVEVILFRNYSLNSWNQKELVRWLRTTLQSTILLQQEKAQKISLRILKDTPAIYMS